MDHLIEQEGGVMYRLLLGLVWMGHTGHYIQDQLRVWQQRLCLSGLDRQGGPIDVSTDTLGRQYPVLSCAHLSSSYERTIVLLPA